MSHEIHEESWIYQEIIEKGIVQGSETGTQQRREWSSQQGIRPAEKTALQFVLTNLIKSRSPAVLPLVQEWLNTPVDANTFKTIIHKLLKVQTEAEVRQILKETS